jgi:hypothetical protein
LADGRQSWTITLYSYSIFHFASRFLWL